MDKSVVLGLCGVARVGKTTTAELLKQRLKNQGHACVILAFAEPVKEIANYFGWDGKKDERGRKLLQQIGTDVGRNYNPSIWVDRWTQRATSFMQQGISVLTDDVRFQNEIHAIRSVGGLCLRLHPGCREIDGLVGELSGHKSEQPDQLHTDGVVNAEQTPDKVCDDILAVLENWYAKA